LENRPENLKIMKNILLFIKDFELGSKVSSACVDAEMNVEFCDETTSPDDFVEESLIAIIDLDEDVFFSIGLVSELKRHGLKIIGYLEELKARDLKKLKSAGCDLVLPKSSLVKNLPKLINELIV
jgi:hypothetical protein|tara:strand:- start:4259 stop:4633 length:375 start_codon:yes stop_codon:yes gene_type:complete